MDLPRCRIEEIRAAHDIGDALLGVVHRDGELIGIHAVCAIEHEIADLRVPDPARCGPALASSNAILASCGADAPRRAVASRRQAFAARSRIHVTFDARDCGIGDLAAAAGARIDAALPPQLVQRAVIRFGARALMNDGAVPFHAAGGERSQYVFQRARRDARRIEIFDAHEPCSAVHARFEKAAHRRDEGAEMQRARGRGRKAPAIGFVVRGSCFVRRGGSFVNQGAIHQEQQ